MPGNVFHDMQQAVEIDSRHGPGVALDGLPSDSAGRTSASIGHRDEVSGLFIDMTCSVLVSCGYDKLVCFWDFHTHSLLSSISLPCPQVLMQGFRDADFVAVAGQDRTIRLFDAHSQRLCRHFAKGHLREITDMAFTPDGRRLLSSGMDAYVRVWDIPTGRCLAWLVFNSPVLSMSVSLSGEYLCVAQADKEGIFMYIDTALYQTVHLSTDPTVPTPISDSHNKVDSAAASAESGVETDGEAGSDQGDQGDQELEEEDGKVTVTAPQGQVVGEQQREASERKGPAGHHHAVRGAARILDLAVPPRSHQAAQQTQGGPRTAPQSALLPAFPGSRWRIGALFPHTTGIHTPGAAAGARPAGRGKDCRRAGNRAFYRRSWCWLEEETASGPRRCRLAGYLGRELESSLG